MMVAEHCGKSHFSSDINAMNIPDQDPTVDGPLVRCVIADKKGCASTETMVRAAQQ
jgi:hypothetical protein